MFSSNDPNFDIRQTDVIKYAMVVNAMVAVRSFDILKVTEVSLYNHCIEAPNLTAKHDFSETS